MKQLCPSMCGHEKGRRQYGQRPDRAQNSLTGDLGRVRSSLSVPRATIISSVCLCSAFAHPTALASIHRALHGWQDNWQANGLRAFEDTTNINFSQPIPERTSILFLKTHSQQTDYSCSKTRGRKAEITAAVGDGRFSD